MKPGRAILLVLSAVLFAGASASAATNAPACEDRAGDPVCLYQDTGLLPLPDWRERGAEVLRFFGDVSTRHGQDFLFELIHERGGYRVAIHYPRAPSRVVEAPVSIADWRRFLTWRNEVAAAAAAEARRGKAPSDMIVVCNDGAGLAMQSLLHGRISHADILDCGDTTIDALMDTIRDAVYRLVPVCGAMDVSFRPYCAALDGDKMRAAAMVGPALYEAQVSLCKDDRPDALRGAALALDGKDVDADVFRKAVCGDVYFRPFRMTASGTTLTISGEARGDWNEPAGGGAQRHTLTAPYTQVWRIEGKSVTLQSWRAGAFAAVD